MDDEMRAAMEAAKNFDPNKAKEEAAPVVDGAVTSDGQMVELPESKDNNANYCPVCGEVFTSRARSLQIESTCRNGHTWHVCAVHGFIMEGAAPKDAGYSCTCLGPEKMHKVLEERKKRLGENED